MTNYDQITAAMRVSMRILAIDELAPHLNPERHLVHPQSYRALWAYDLATYYGNFQPRVLTRAGWDRLYRFARTLVHELALEENKRLG